MYGATTYAPGIKESSFIEQLGAFTKEISIFIKFYFKWRKVEYLVVTLYLAKIGDQDSIEGKGLIDSIFQIQATIDLAGPIFTPAVWEG